MLYPSYKKRTCKHKELSLNFRGVYPVQPGTSREIKGQKEGGISFSDFDFDLTRRDLVLKTFRNKFTYLNHLKINSRYKFSYWWKEFIVGSPGYNLCLTIITASTDFLEKNEEILKDRNSSLIGSWYFYRGTTESSISNWQSNSSNIELLSHFHLTVIICSFHYVVYTLPWPPKIPLN